MPGLTPRNMNGYDYNRGGASQYMVNGGGPYGAFSDPRDEYSSGHRESPYRLRDDIDDPYYRGDRPEDIYRKPMKRGGYGNDLLHDDHSLAEYAGRSNEPVFEVDHLATYSAGKAGVRAEEGIHRLRTMEDTTGIWTMRCILIIERRWILVLDKSTGEELEKFPIECVVEPTAVIKNDRRDVYNNLILFTVVEDTRRRSSQADLHIFQSIKAFPQDIVDEIIAAKEGRGRLRGGQRIPPPPMHPAPEPPRGYGMYNFTNQHFGGGSSMINRTQRPFLSDSGQNEVLEKDVQLLNHCFDDIERFVARLQQAAEAYKELERRRRERGNRGKPNRRSGDGMLSHRARPPPGPDFIDIFQKFKFSFNLLAKLKAHIHDPNAPELVHFLFTPLSLIYEASRDPSHSNRDLADGAVAPVLTHEAKQLLLNCLTSKEIDLWQALGPKWTTSREEWRGMVPQFSPIFYDGWRPSPGDIDEPHLQVPIETAVMAHHNQIMNRTHESDTRPMPPERPSYHHQEDPMYAPRIMYESRPSPRVPSPRPPSPQLTRSVNRPEPSRQQPQAMSREDDNTAYLHELQRDSILAYEAVNERQGKNAKEISVKKGDILQVLDDSRKWWKVRNCKGESGYAPYTILAPVKDDGFRQDSGPERLSGNYSSYFQGDSAPSPPMAPPTPDQLRGNKQHRRGEFKYF